MYFHILEIQQHKHVFLEKKIFFFFIYAILPLHCIIPKAESFKSVDVATTITYTRRFERKV